MLTPELGERILELIVTELISVRAAMQRVGLVPSQVHRWKKTDVQFRNQYEYALALRTDLQLGEIIRIADNCSAGMVRKVKLQLDARKWILSRMMRLRSRRVIPCFKAFWFPAVWVFRPRPRMFQVTGH